MDIKNTVIETLSIDRNNNGLEIKELIDRLLYNNGEITQKKISERWEHKIYKENLSEKEDEIRGSNIFLMGVPVTENREWKQNHIPKEIRILI